MRNFFDIFFAGKKTSANTLFFMIGLNNDLIIVISIRHKRKPSYGHFNLWSANKKRAQ